MTPDFYNSVYKSLKAQYYHKETGDPLEGVCLDNFDLMEDYIIRRNEEGFTRSTVTVDMKALIVFSKCIDKDINVLVEKDLRNFFKYLSDKSKATARLYKIQVGNFLKFAKREDLAVLCKTRKSKSENKLISPNELLTIEEVEKLIDAATTLRDKALISVLYETGAREGEIEELRISDVKFDEYGAVLNLKPGKTGARRNRCIFAASYLRQWYDCHPRSKDMNSYLWLSAKLEKHVSYSTIWLLLRECAKNAGITKRVNPHSFRHSRATYLAKYMTEQQLKTQLGWTPGSSMAGRYVHMSGEDLDPVILKINGVEIEEKDKKDDTNPIRCQRCKEFNNRKSSFCFRCGYPVSETAISQMQKYQDQFEVVYQYLQRVREDEGK